MKEIKSDIYSIFTAGISKASTNTPEGSVSSQLAGRNEGPADAYRHLLLSAELTRRYGEEYARLLLDLHEEGEVGASTAMDAHNNDIGIAVGNAIRNGGGGWQTVIATIQEVMVENLADYTYTDITPSASWKEQPEGNLVLQQTFTLSNGVAIPGISLQENGVWGNNPLLVIDGIPQIDENGDPIHIYSQDCNWPTRDGSWLTRFVAETYAYPDLVGIPVLLDTPLGVAISLETGNVDGNELVELHVTASGGTIPYDIDAQLSKLFAQVSANTAPSLQTPLQALPLVVAEQTEEKFLYIGTDAAEACYGSGKRKKGGE